MFSELASSLCEQDLAPNLFTDFARPSFWQTLSASQCQALIRQGEKTMQEEWPVFYASDWLAFTYTGNRADFEKRYFTRRRMLNDLVLAECAENEGRFLERIIDGIWLICEESAWQVPAHNSYIRDTPQLPLPDTSRPILDLFACETGALLALAHRLLKDRFSPVHAQVCRRIEQELEHRIYTPYLKDYFWWMGNGDEPMCNWTTWCTQNILISFFALPQSPETALTVVRQACTSLDCFWKDYGPDGCCREGAHYYRAAGLCLCQCLDFLTQLAPGVFDNLWNDTKLQNMVAFVLHMHVGGEYYLNYADCSPKIGPCGVREYLFAARTGCTELMSLAAEQYQSQPLPPSSMNGVNLFYRLQELVLDEVVRRHPMTPIHHGEVYYPSTGIWITRDERYCLSAKAGCNADSHNHNDTGSLIVYLNEKPFLIDIGVESYSKKTFSAQRYEIWTMQSAWHNLPTFDGVMQEFGPQYGAGTVNNQFGSEKSSFSMELAAAWPKEAHLSRYTRTVTLYKGSHIEVQEQCSGTFHSAVLSLLFCQEPCVAGPDQLQTIDGLIRFTGAQGIQIESVSVTDPRLRSIWGSWFSIPNEFRHRVLYWGVLGAIVFRAIFVAVGTGLLSFGPYVELIFAAMVAYTGFVMLKKGDQEEEIEDYSSHIAYKGVKRIFPMWPRLHGHDFFITRKHATEEASRLGITVEGMGHKIPFVATPLFLCLAVIEVSDVMFAFDSVPAVIAVSREPLIIYSAMIFAILGLRSLYFVLEAMSRYLVHLEKAVIVLLFFIAAKLLLSALKHGFGIGFELSPHFSLVVVLAVLAVGIIASIISATQRKNQE